MGPWTIQSTGTQHFELARTSAVGCTSGSGALHPSEALHSQRRALKIKLDLKPRVQIRGTSKKLLRTSTTRLHQSQYPKFQELIVKRLLLCQMM